jgi:DNA-binding transcriptional LysR family regulator
VDSWLGVELRHLAALAAIAEEESFRGAADRLGYVQSAVSQRIAQLEQLVGARLVERSRGHRHVELTDAGRTLLHHAEQIQAQLNAARADLRSLTENLGSPSLRVGAFGSLATRLLPQALARLAARAPELRLETREALSDAELFAAVREGQLDAAFAELPLQAGPFDWQELLVDPSVLLVPADSRLAGRVAPPNLADIAQQPLVVDTTWRMFALIEAEFAAAGLEIDARFSASSNAAVQALVGAGLGVAIVPHLAVDLEDPATEAIDLDGLIPSRTLVCYWPQVRRRGSALQAFLEAMNSVCAPLRDDDAERAARVELAA